MTTAATATPGGNRHRGREVALQVLYAIDLGARSAASDVPRESSFEGVREHFDVPASAADFARGLVDGVVGDLEGLDALIAAHARNWRVSRMAVVDRNVLRLAVHELRDTDTPVAVVIDEAVDLARRFGGDASPGFVNGVLDAVAKELRAA